MTREFTIVDVAQGSPEWFAARLGRLTGSVAGNMLAKLANGKPAAGRYNLLLRLVLENLTGKPQAPTFQSGPMLVGTEREPLARFAYEAMTGEVVTETGFLTHPTLMAGASLDGHIGDFGKLLSIKCRQPAAHYECLRTNKIQADALAQIRHELWLTGAEEHDYFSWNPDFPEHMQCHLITVKRADADIAAYDVEARKFLEEVDREVSAAHGFTVLKASA